MISAFMTLLCFIACDCKYQLNVGEAPISLNTELNKGESICINTTLTHLNVVMNRYWETLLLPYTNRTSQGEFTSNDYIGGFYYGNSVGSLTIISKKKKAEISLSAVAAPKCEKIILTNRFLDEFSTKDVLEHQRTCYFNAANGATNFKISMNDNSSLSFISKEGVKTLEGQQEETKYKSSASLTVFEKGETEPKLSMESMNFNYYPVIFIRNAFTGKKFVAIQGTYNPTDINTVEIALILAVGIIILITLFSILLLCCTGFVCFNGIKFGYKFYKERKGAKESFTGLESNSEDDNGEYTNITNAIPQHTIPAPGV